MAGRTLRSSTSRGLLRQDDRLSAEAEPEIFATTKRFGTVLENVVMDEVTRELDLDDFTLAENSRGAYPIDFIPNSSDENMDRCRRTSSC